MSMAEMEVRSVVDDGEDVIYMSIPHYNGADGSLSGIQVIAIGDQGYYADKCFENSRNGGIVNGGSC
jgi:hypothetical protein